MKHPYKTGDHSLVREMNLATVLQCLQHRKSLSRAGLAALTGLNKTTISSLVEELIDGKLVYETGQEASRTGRPATLLELSPHAGQIIGLELGVDFITIILTDFLGQPLWRITQETDPAQPQDTIIQTAIDLVGTALANNRAAEARMLGLGLTLPGMVDVSAGILLFSPNLQWRNVNLRKIFQDRFKMPVYVENDANAAAIGEHFFGVARQTQHFISLTIGVGIGSGLFLGGDLYRGATGIAGEVGHINLRTDRNRPCRCGKRGCWETSGNQYALFERVRALLDVGRSSLVAELMTQHNSRLTLAMIAQAAEQGDEVVIEALVETGAAIGLGVANLIDIFNPELVVIGGAMSVVGVYLLPAIQDVVYQQALAETRQQTRVVLSNAGEDASVVGAVALVVSAILANPTQVQTISVPI